MVIIRTFAEQGCFVAFLAFCYKAGYVFAAQLKYWQKCRPDPGGSGLHRMTLYSQLFATKQRAGVTGEGVQIGRQEQNAGFVNR
ncbi:MAG: hypothetical protein RJQ10_01115 [Haliea sp.]|uniref:hypothetical protein n=1 Tax=Haliea sp. TaxID=1932666 RepID=UPI0032EE0289